MEHDETDGQLLSFPSSVVFSRFASFGSSFILGSPLLFHGRFAVAMAAQSGRADAARRPLAALGPASSRPTNEREKVDNLSSGKNHNKRLDSSRPFIHVVDVTES